MKKPTLREAYQQRVAKGELAADPAQQKTLEAFVRLAAALSAWQERSGRRGLLRLFGRPKPPQGLYLWGEVGRGKTMLMDLFLGEVSLPYRRVHFHAFMQEVHAAIHRLRQKGLEENPVIQVAEAMAKDTRLLCLDEFQVHDVADAMILSQLFETLMENDVVVVMTSNRRPDDLYPGGLQRERFERFIEWVKARMQVVKLEGAEDYRIGQVKAMERVYHFPLGPAAERFMQAALARFAHGRMLETRTLEVQGRDLPIRTADAKTASMHFDELCVRPLGAADYLAIAREFSVVLLAGIPKLGAEKRNEAKRFVTLIDALYEHKVKLIATADAGPAELYPAGDGTFEFQRTASRLMEMQSAQYIAASHLP